MILRGLLSISILMFFYSKGASQCFFPHPEDDTADIEVQRLAGDDLSTVFAIWVGNKVRPHYHAHHSETVVVLEGEALMRLGDKYFPIKSGASIFIPKGTIHSVEVTSEQKLKVISVQAPRFEGKDRIFIDQNKD